MRESAVMASPLNASFCKQKIDGTYSTLPDCRQFVLCAHGIAHRKTCPNGLRYNSKEAVCDWPSNVNCDWPRSEGYLSSASAQNSTETDDEEVYTRKFMKETGRTPIHKSSEKLD